MSVVISLLMCASVLGWTPKMCTGSYCVWEAHTLLVHYWPHQIFFYLPYCHLEVAQINTCIKNTLMLGSTLEFETILVPLFVLFYAAVAMQQCCSGTAVWMSNLLVEGCRVSRSWHIMFVLNLFLMHLNTQHKTALGLRISLNNN